MFYYLTKRQNILPIGLYRLAGCKDNKFPYVCTNPDPQTKLSEKDMIFVLAQNTPSELSKFKILFILNSLYCKILIFFYCKYNICIIISCFYYLMF